MAKRKTDSEVTLAVVFRKTPDGYVVGRALVPLDGVEWISPTHTRDWQETRPTDIPRKTEKVRDENGLVTLRPASVVKGKPRDTVVGRHVVFGESPDAAVDRAKRELQLQVAAELARNAPTWRHLCREQLIDGLPTWAATPVGAECVHCGREQKAKVAA